MPEPLAALDVPVLYQVPGRVERLLVVEEADPQSGKSADAAPAAAVGAAHFEEALQTHLGECRREVICPVGDRRLLAGELGKLAIDEGSKAFARYIDIFAVAVDEVHRHIEHVVAVALV